VHGGDDAQDRQRRERFELAVAEVPRDGGYGHRVGAGRLQPPGQPLECHGLGVAAIGAQVRDQLGSVGVDDGEIEPALRTCMGGREVPIVELGCRRADAADEADVHGPSSCLGTGEAGRQ
jgi:hypothetical protein